MKPSLPRISVIIPAKSEGLMSSALTALKKVKYPIEKIEVIAVYGQSPSKQRNVGIKKSKGKILYFLDNDSKINPWAFLSPLRHW